MRKRISDCTYQARRQKLMPLFHILSSTEGEMVASHFKVLPKDLEFRIGFAEC